jgi:hypothetical protein
MDVDLCVGVSHDMPLRWSLSQFLGMVAIEILLLRSMLLALANVQTAGSRLRCLFSAEPRLLLFAEGPIARRAKTEQPRPSGLGRRPKRNRPEGAAECGGLSKEIRVHNL